MKIPFDTWKAEYEPRISLDMECDEHEECECEVLYPYHLSEIDDYEDEDSLRLAIEQDRVWTWDNRGIRSGIDKTEPWADLLITKKAWTEETEVA